VVDSGFTVFACGDVMTGRGVDQILRHPSPPAIQEAFVRDARTYVALAEGRNGPIPRGVDDAYVWGEALEELERAAPDARIVNLETSVTESDEAWPKGINYRMHPANVACLTAAGLDVCVLANNHILDYGWRGLFETLETLAAAGIQTVGAGRDEDEALRPARVTLAPGQDLLVFAFGCETSGVPDSWAASASGPGAAFLGELSREAARAVVDRIARARGPKDIVVVSIHWGSNWGYEVPRDQVRFAHWLVDGGVDVVHGHSSHHPRPAEVYAGRLILYGCGDFIHDYEGISGYEEFRNDLVLMHLVTFGPTGDLVKLRMVPFQVRRLRLQRASDDDTAWMARRLSAASARFGSRVEQGPDGVLVLLWDRAGAPRVSRPAGDHAARGES
jgi:poly-gamma-glutamate capsule biosynthesis protein CapA/YwtB (metallophosphatase superfamily)